MTARAEGTAPTLLPPRAATGLLARLPSGSRGVEATGTGAELTRIGAVGSSATVCAARPSRAITAPNPPPTGAAEAEGEGVMVEVDSDW